MTVAAPRPALSAWPTNLTLSHSIDKKMTAKIDHPVQQKTDNPAAERAFTPRAILTGCLGAFGVSAGAAYGTQYIQGSFMALGTSMPGAVFLLFVLTLFINPLLKSIHPGAGLNRRALVCPCMDVTVAEVLDLVAQGIDHVEEIKRLTACGMGPCQGVPCWDQLAATLAATSGRPVASFGNPTYRPPRAGLTLAQAAGLHGLVGS